MAKKEYFPPLWTTFSRCKDYYFLARVPRHFFYVFFWLMLERTLQGFSKTLPPQWTALMEQGFLIGLCAIGIVAVAQLVICSYTRLWLAPEGVVWRSLWGRDAISWDEIKGYQEGSWSIFPMLQVTSEGILFYPASFVGSLDPFRQAMLLKGIPCRVSDRYHYRWWRDPWDTTKSIGTSAICIGLVEGVFGFGSLLDRILGWVGLLGFIGWAAYTLFTRARSIKIRGSILEEHRFSMSAGKRIDLSLAQFKTAYWGPDGLPSGLTLTSQSQGGQPSSTILDKNYLNFESICRRLERYHPSLVIRIDQSETEDSKGNDQASCRPTP